MNKAFSDLQGQTIDGLYVRKVVRLTPHCAYEVHCHRCGAIGTATYASLIGHYAKCQAQGCGTAKPPRPRQPRIARPGGSVRINNSINESLYEDRQAQARAERQREEEWQRQQRQNRRDETLGEWMRMVDFPKDYLPHLQYFWNVLHRGELSMTYANLDAALAWIQEQKRNQQ